MTQTSSWDLGENKMNIMESVKKLVEYHTEAEPSIIRVYRFPSEQEIRLVEVDEETWFTDGDRMEAWYFGTDPNGGIQYPAGVALIRPEEESRLLPPEGWGDWSEAELVWQRMVVHA